MTLVALTAAEIYALQILASLVAAGPQWRRVLALAVAAPNFALPWQAPADLPVARAMLALVASFGYARLLDLALARGALSPARRVWHAVALLDTRRMMYARPALDAPALARAVGYGALSAAAAWVCVAGASRVEGALHHLATLGGGVVFMYALTDAVYAAVALLFRLAGVVVYDLHRAPILSRTVREFWGERWARTVSALLFARTLRPLARRGMPRVGIVASFAASAAFHAFVILPALGWRAAAMWGSYFLVQAALVLVEAAMGVPRWRRPLAHTWVAVVMLGTSPLMVVPMLWLMGAAP